MKWFQVDADTPNDPKIRAILRELGPAGFGGLMLLWCHIADHGAGEPGCSIDSAGRPIPRADLVEASRLDPDTFDRLINMLIQTGHIDSEAWSTREILAIPAMARRADVYTKRLYAHNVRTHFAQTSKSVRQQTNKQTNKQYKQTNTRLTARPRATPPAWRLNIPGTGCPHTPRCATKHACIEKTLSSAKKRRNGGKP